MTSQTLAPSEFSRALETYYEEASDDMRKVVVGLQEESHAAEIYSRHAHLYTAEQLQLLREARDRASDPREQEQLKRLWHEAASGIADRHVIKAYQDLNNERLAYRATWDGEEVSLNTLGALLNNEPGFERREQLYALVCEADESFAAREVALAQEAQRLRSEVYGLSGEIEIASERMGIDVEAFERQVRHVAEQTSSSYYERSAEHFSRLLGRDVERPSRAHAQYMRSLHPYSETYTREKMLPVCERTLSELGFALDSIPTIRPDLEDRPQKSPRACVIATKVPHEVHLVVRPTGGLTDYQAFLHEAGHALHFGLVDASLPMAFRTISPDYALTEIYSYVVERITHLPAWHERHFGVSRDAAERVCADIRFTDAMLFRRYAAKLRYELSFWPDPESPHNPERYATLLSEYTQMTYPTSQFASDIDAGLYAADYLRAWRTSEQVMKTLDGRFGEMWFCNPEAGAWLRDLFEQGTEPTNEQVSAMVGSSADDYDALTDHLVA